MTVARKGCKYPDKKKQYFPHEKPEIQKVCPGYNSTVNKCLMMPINNVISSLILHTEEKEKGGSIQLNKTAIRR